MTRLFVGNLPPSAPDDSVRDLFASHGTVDKVAVIVDRETRVPRGFGFVEMSDSDASRAIQALHGSDFEGRSLKVSEARERATGAGREPRRI